MTATKSQPINIFDLLKKIDIKDIHYYNSLDDAQKKGFVPVVIMQWLMCCEDDLQRIMVNEYVNKYVFKLYKHPELLYQLMVCCTTGNPKFYKWNKNNNASTKFPKSIKIIKDHLQISTKRAIADFHLIPNEEILMLACDLGYQKDDFKDLQNELKLRI
jgi:hypothetical protein